MRRTKLTEMIPLDAPCECPYNCVGCEHLNGIVYYGNDDVEVECDLDEEVKFPKLTDEDIDKMEDRLITAVFE